jgi:hypothetical protein
MNVYTDIVLGCCTALGNWNVSDEVSVRNKINYRIYDTKYYLHVPDKCVMFVVLKTLNYKYTEYATFPTAMCQCACMYVHLLPFFLAGIF